MHMHFLKSDFLSKYIMFHSFDSAAHCLHQWQLAAARKVNPKQTLSIKFHTF